jgi:Flp pilus assembly protein TadB
VLLATLVVVVVAVVVVVVVAAVVAAVVAVAARLTSKGLKRRNVDQTQEEELDEVVGCNRRRSSRPSWFDLVRRNSSDDVNWYH